VKGADVRDEGGKCPYKYHGDKRRERCVSATKTMQSTISNDHHRRHTARRGALSSSTNTQPSNQVVLYTAIYTVRQKKTNQLSSVCISFNT